MITEAEWVAMRAAAKRAAAALPPLTPDQVALVCELLDPLSPDEIRALRARKDTNDGRSTHPTRREARSA